MHITLFSFVTAVLLSSLLIVALYLSRKSAKTIRMLNFGYLACLYLFCLGRMFFSVELPFTIVVNAPTFMNPVSKFYRNTTLIAGSHFSKYELLLLLWVIGAIFLLTRFFLRYIGEKRRIDRLFKQKNQAIQDLLDMLRKDKKFTSKCYVVQIYPHLVESDYSDGKFFYQARNIRKKNCFISCAMNCNIFRPMICWSSG